jgi:hypothetical protein
MLARRLPARRASPRARSHRFALTIGVGTSLYFLQREQIVSLAARYGIPVIYPWREFVDAGGLVCYGPNLVEAYRISGTYAGRILKGEKPGYLPVQQSTRIETIVNPKTAKALGPTIPTNLLVRADGGMPQTRIAPARRRRWRLASVSPPLNSVIVRALRPNPWHSCRP